MSLIWMNINLYFNKTSSFFILLLKKLLKFNKSRAINTNFQLILDMSLIK
jgi:hypothetical protein